jgi:hypothetical protein
MSSRWMVSLIFLRSFSHACRIANLPSSWAVTHLMRKERTLPTTAAKEKAHVISDLARRFPSKSAVLWSSTFKRDRDNRSILALIDVSSNTIIPSAKISTFVEPTPNNISL